MMNLKTQTSYLKINCGFTCKLIVDFVKNKLLEKLNVASFDFKDFKNNENKG